MPQLLAGSLVSLARRDVIATLRQAIPADIRAMHRVRLAVTTALLLLALHGSLAHGADFVSDAPERPVLTQAQPTEVPSYQAALRTWRNAEDVSNWISARFEYDVSRAMLLSETQRDKSHRIAIHDPQAFFAAPSGTCVDLSRFAVETLRVVDPKAKPAYLMIEFAPVSIGGNTLRRHWLASFERDGKRYFFADSKRPGHIAGPHASTREFIDEYAKYRGREVITFREMDSYLRKARAVAARKDRDRRP